MSVSPTVLVACDDLILLDEVIRHLEEIPYWKLAMSARSAAEVLQQDQPIDCILMSDGIASALASRPAAVPLQTRVVVFGRREHFDVLKAALKLGAGGFVLWPDDKQQVRALVERGRDLPSAVNRGAGELHLCWGPKGGAGTSVIAAHLAGSLALLKRRVVLVDLDLDHADQSCILGADPQHRSVGELLRLGDEITPEVVESVLWSHPLGFRALLAPGSVGRLAAADLPAAELVLAALRASAEHVVVDLPSGMSPVLGGAMARASSLQLVVTPDLLALRRTGALLAALDGSLPDRSRVTVILNQAGGPDITGREVEAALGPGRVVRVKARLSTYRSVNRAELSPATCRALMPLARVLSAAPQPPAAAEGPPAAGSDGWAPAIPPDPAVVSGPVNAGLDVAGSRFRRGEAGAGRP